MLLEFSKMQALGNDFVFIHNIEPKKLTKSVIQFLCNRQMGIGGDGLVLVTAEEDKFRYQYFNQDGTTAMCGNGLCAATKFITDRYSKKGFIEILTNYGDRRGRVCQTFDVTTSLVEVTMGMPKFLPTEIPMLGLETPKVIEQEILGYKITLVNMGNPHCVIFVNNVGSFELMEVGKMFQSRKDIFPESVNVNVAQVLDDMFMKVRTYERGVGETQACGTGACAVAWAGFLSKRTAKQVNIQMQSGCLFVDLNEKTFETMLQVPATTVFTGQIHVI